MNPDIKRGLIFAGESLIPTGPLIRMAVVLRVCPQETTALFKAATLEFFKLAPLYLMIHSEIDVLVKTGALVAYALIGAFSSKTVEDAINRQTNIG